MLALLSGSCVAQRSTVSEQESKSLINFNERGRIVQTTLPSSKAVIGVTLDRLKEIPSGMTVIEDSGYQAKLTLERHGDSIYITARCDSILLLVQEYERQLQILGQASIAEVEEKTRSPSVDIFLLGVIAGVVIGGYLSSKQH
ncbi:MAG: hypothetical protein ACRCZM_09530 [Bacteroidales bacterium]